MCQRVRPNISYEVCRETLWQGALEDSANCFSLAYDVELPLGFLVSSMLVDAPEYCTGCPQSTVLYRTVLYRLYQTVPANGCLLPLVSALSARSALASGPEPPKDSPGLAPRRGPCLDCLWRLQACFYPSTLQQAGSCTFGTYTVQRGDTCSRIYVKVYRRSPQLFYASNREKCVNSKLWLGRELCRPL